MFKIIFYKIDVHREIKYMKEQSRNLTSYNSTHVTEDGKKYMLSFDTSKKLLRRFIIDKIHLT